MKTEYSFFCTLLFITGFFLLGHLAPALAATNITLDSSSYNYSLNGASSSDNLGYFFSDSPVYTDIDGNGNVDAIIYSQSASNNGQSNSGSVYIIMDTILATFTTLGQNVDLSNPDNYSYRIDGAEAGDKVRASAYDIDGDNKKDIIIHPYTAQNGFANAGSIWIINYNKLTSYPTKNVRLNNSANYTVRLDGDIADGYLGNINVASSDIDGDGKTDILISNHHAGHNGLHDSGSAYLIKGSLLSTKSGNLSLGDGGNYNIRFDGPVAGNTLGGGDVAFGDINNDGRVDIILASDYADPYGRTDSGSVWIIDNSIYTAYTGTGNNIMITQDGTPDNNNWTYRIDAALAGDRLSYANVTIADVDGDNKDDILLGSWFSSYDGTLTGTTRSGSGSLYIILGKDLHQTTTKGNLYDLANSNNFFARIDGASANDQLTFVGGDALGDITNDGTKDIVVSASFANSQFGYTYVISGSKLNYGSSTRGTILDMANSDNYTVRYAGNQAQRLLVANPKLVDINKDNSADLILTGYTADSLTRTDNGIIYIIYSFPHSITGSTSQSSYSSGTVSVTGTVSAPNSVTNIAGVAYQFDSNSLSGNWTNCTADDGNFNSKSEAYTCDLGTPSDLAHTVYIRAIDTNGTYTPQLNYKSVSFTYDANPPSFVSVVSPGKTVNYRDLTLIFKKATDSLGTTGYNISVDESPLESLHIAGLPAHGDGSENYLWKNDDNFEVRYANEGDSDTSNDLIKVTFKKFKDSFASLEGYHNFKITAYDAAGNSRDTGYEVKFDLTSPQLYDINFQDGLVAFSGYVRDDMVNNVVSGPDKLRLVLELQRNQTYVQIGQVEQDRSDYQVKTMPDSSIGGNFYIEYNKKLSAGHYRAKITSTDYAGNSHETGYYTFDVQKPSAPKTKAKLANKIVNQESPLPTPTAQITITPTPNLPNQSITPPAPHGALQSLIRQIRDFFIRLFRRR